MLWAISSLPGDRRKARSDLAKHGVSFDEAEDVFSDEGARLLDPDHSEAEERFLWSFR
jgi:uncharacterized protein